jgi:hypothetical protein
LRAHVDKRPWPASFAFASIRGRLFDVGPEGDPRVLMDAPEPLDAGANAAVGQSTHGWPQFAQKSDLLFISSAQNSHANHA